jgi:hypothetical protein
MLRAEKYLENYYTKYPKDYYNNFLQSFGCWMYYDKFLNDLKKFEQSNSNIDFFYKIVDFYYKKHTQNLKSYNKSTIIKSVLKTNLKQYSQLKKQDFKVNITTTNSPSPDKLVGIYNFKIKKYKINCNRDIKKRKIIFYYKTGDTFHTNYNESEKVGTDIFQLCLLYKIVEKMINDRLIRNFNDVLITPKYENHEPEFLTKDLNFNVKYFKHTEYINQMCLYSNPFHFYGGNIEAGFAKSKPMICSTLAIQKPYVNNLEDYMYMPFYYAKGKVFDQEIKIDGYDGDKELQMRWGEKGHNYCQRMMKHAKNNSIDSLFKTFINRLVLLDNMM